MISFSLKRFAQLETTSLINRYCATFVFVLALALTACSQHSADWSKVQGHGPLIAKGQFAPLYRQCGGDHNRHDSKNCQLAFEDSVGNKIRLSDLAAQLDDTLLQTKEAQSWPLNGNGQRKQPYRFTILSLSPTIVVGYPVTSSTTDRCLNASSSCNYLHSDRFSNRYEIANQFSYSPDLIWFSPEHGARLFKVPRHANSVFFMIAGQSAQLRRNGNNWLFTRRD